MPHSHCALYQLFRTFSFAQSITFDPRSGLMDVNKWAFLDQADLHPTRILCRNLSTR